MSVSGEHSALLKVVDERLNAKKITPMMRQYLGVKKEHPGSVILFRMGDFFEAFYEDAEECARLLELTLTARSKEKDIPMAGVPHHAIDTYLARLIELGRTVVLVDQIEDPKQAKGLVRRAVTRVLSPGTFVDPHAPPRMVSYLVSIAFSPARGRKKGFGEWGLAALDLSTGEFRATSGPELEALLEELARLGTREVLVYEGLRGDEKLQRIQDALEKVTITYLGEASHSRQQATAALADTLGEDEVKGLKTTLPEVALVAAGRCLMYAKETQLRPEAVDLRGKASLNHVESLRPYVPGEALVLDAQARDHLELFSSQGEGGTTGSLIGAIDEAVTSMGGRLLVRWLAYPLRDVWAIHDRQDAIAALLSAPTLLDQLRRALTQVSDMERLLGRVVMGRAGPRDLSALRAALFQAPAVLTCASSAAFGMDSIPPAISGKSSPEKLKSAHLKGLAQVDDCADVLEAIDGALVEDPPNDLTGQLFRDGFDSDLDELMDLSRNGKSKIAALEAKEKEQTGITSLRVRYNKVFGYYIEVTKTNLKLVPKRYVRKQTTVNSERFFTEELKELETKVLHAEERRISRTAELFNALLIKVSARVSHLRALSKTIAELDVLSSFAHLAEQRSWVRPVVDESTALDIQDGRHPVIEQLSTELGETFVPNDISICGDERLMIITGPNMAGKSTIMRQTALIAILAHMGAYVPAKSAKVGLLDRVFTRVGASDDLSRGRSTFMVEMNETARILRSATDRSLILLDEIGRGTSTFDGLSIAWAVAEYIHDKIGAKTLFATHYHELTEICRDKKHAINRHVAVKEWNEDIVFLRKLLPGATNRSYGVQVARLAGLPAAVITRARQVLDSLEAQALTAGDESAVTYLAKSRAPTEKAKEQMHLFSVPPPLPEPKVDPVVEEVVGMLEGMSVDDITPRQALDHLAALQEKLKGLEKS